MISAAALFLLAQVTTTSPAPVPSPRPTPSGPVVVLETSMGRIRIGLYDDKSPVSTENFLKYVRKGHYNGTIFHRVIPTFMVQGGGMSADMTEKPTDAPIRNEARNGLRNSRGSVAMARTNDPNSATAQFFINLKDNASLDFGIRGMGYAVFGEVIEGMEVVDKIAAVQTTRRGQNDDVPVTAILITSAKVEGGGHGAAGHGAAGIAASFPASFPAGDRAATRASEPPGHSAAEPGSAPVNA